MQYISLLNVGMAIWLATNTKTANKTVPVPFCFYRIVTHTVYRWYIKYKLLKFKQLSVKCILHV